MNIIKKGNFKIIECTDEEKELIEKTTQLLTKISDCIETELDDKNIESVYLEDELDNMFYALANAAGDLL